MVWTIIETRRINNIVQVDQSTFDFPRNTTWDSPQKLPNQHEPYSPLPVTLDMVQNPENNDQNSPGGFPGRFCQKPKSIWFSNSGEITPALENMFKNREAAINSLTREITAFDYPEWRSTAFWIDPNGKQYPVRTTSDKKNTHVQWVYNNQGMLRNEYGIAFKTTDFGHPDEGIFDYTKINTTLITNGWIRVDGNGLDVADINNVPQFVFDLNFISNEYVSIEDLNHNWIQILWKYVQEDGQKAINKAVQERRLAPVAKQGSSNIFMLDTDSGLQTKALRDPTPEQAINLFNRTRGEVHQLRWFVSSDGHLYMWDAYDLTHWDAIKQLGIPMNKGVEEERNTGVARSSYDAELIAEEFRTGIINGYPVMAKKAELIDFQAPNGLTFPVLLNPSKQEFLGAVKKYGIVRLLKGGNGIYVWDANEMTHLDMVKALRALGYEDAENYFPKKGYTSKSVGDKVTIEDMNGHWADISIDELLSSQLVMAKQAGSQSASVPDYLCDEWKTEQINNDTDEEPYVNHDQRDYPFGMHDSPENTDSGIGWAKDNTKSVCLLDQLQNPADRNFPPGMMDYETTIFETYPMSDGIEAHNPD